MALVMFRLTILFLCLITQYGVLSETTMSIPIASTHSLAKQFFKLISFSSCSSNDQCGRNAYCNFIYGQCACHSGYVPASNNIDCIKTLGSNCNNWYDCGNNTICKGSYWSTCQCMTNYVQSSHNKTDCVVKSSYWSCNNYYDNCPTNAWCDQGTCVCYSGYYRDGYSCVKQRSSLATAIVIPVVIIIFLIAVVLCVRRCFIRRQRRLAAVQTTNVMTATSASVFPLPSQHYYPSQSPPPGQVIYQQSPPPAGFSYAAPPPPGQTTFQSPPQPGQSVYPMPPPYSEFPSQPSSNPNYPPSSGKITF